MFSHISHFICLYNFNYTGRPLHGPGIIGTKTGYPNLLHGYDFLCFNLMNYYEFEKYNFI